MQYKIWHESWCTQTDLSNEHLITNKNFSFEPEIGDNVLVMQSNLCDIVWNFKCNF